jgi:hypothetical protein
LGGYSSAELFYASAHNLAAEVLKHHLKSTSLTR